MRTSRQSTILISSGPALLGLLTIFILVVAVSCLPAVDGRAPATATVAQQTATAGIATPTLAQTAAPGEATVEVPATATQEASATATHEATATATVGSATATTQPTATAEVVQPAPINYAMARVDLELHSRPDAASSVVGHMAHGQIARVTGASSDGAWWQLECPNGSGEACYAPAGEPHTLAQPGAQRVHFTPGASTASIEGDMGGEDQVHYVFEAGPDQTITIDVSSPGNGVLFHLQGLADGVIYKHMLNGETSWQGLAPSFTQDYLLALNGSGAYSIDILLFTGDPAAQPTATATKTAEPAPGGPLTPVVDAQSGTLLGGTQNGVWIDAQTYAGYLQDAERPYILYTLAGEQGAVTGSPPVPGGEICDTPLVPFTPGEFDGAIALVARWNAAPRLAQSLPTDTPEYVQLVDQVLQENGLQDPDVRVDRILRVDVDGDGVDEVLITASRLTAGTSPPPVAAGDYSLLLLRKVKGDVVTDVPLGLDVYTEDDDLAYPLRYDVLGLLDLDGNSTLEIIVQATRYEGRQVRAYEMTAAGLQQILQAGCFQ